MGDRRNLVSRGSAAAVAWGAMPAAAVSALLLLSGCARFSPDAGMGVVQSAAAAELGKDVIKIDDPHKEAHVAARVRQLRSEEPRVGKEG